MPSEDEENESGEKVNAEIPQFVKNYALHLGTPIVVWPFYEAPELLRMTCNSNGGDEDWLAVVAPTYKGRYIRWMEDPHFGCSGVDVYRFSDGWSVHVGCHA